MVKTNPPSRSTSRRRESREMAEAAGDGGPGDGEPGAGKQNAAGDGGGGPGGDGGPGPGDKVCCLYRLGDNIGSCPIIYLDNKQSVCDTVSCSSSYSME